MVADAPCTSRRLPAGASDNALASASTVCGTVGKIVIVLHGDEIGFFATRNYAKYKDLMARAQSLTVGGIIDIRMCRVAARRRGLEPQDIHGFVTMVPMADAEIMQPP